MRFVSQSSILFHVIAQHHCGRPAALPTNQKRQTVMRKYITPHAAHAPQRSLVGTLNAIAIFLTIALLTPPAFAQSVDPHQLYEQRCATCHQPHARELVQETLVLRDGNVVLKKSGTLLADFLKRHPHRALEKPQADVLVKQFEAMLETGFVYQQKCGVCHDRAVDLARLRLQERNGTIIGRYTGSNITAFLRTHGRLTPSEVDTMVAMLDRQLSASREP